MHKQYAGLMVALGGLVSLLASSAYAQEDVHVKTNSSRFMTSDPGYNTTVISFELPAGQWILSSEASLVNFGSSDYTRCQLVANGIEIGASTTYIGDLSTYVSTVAIMGSFSSTDVSTIALRCGHDFFRSSPPYVDPQATIWAHRSNDLLQIVQP